MQLCFIFITQKLVVDTLGVWLQCTGRHLYYYKSKHKHGSLSIIRNKYHGSKKKDNSKFGNHNKLE